MKRLLIGVMAIVCAGASAPAHAANGLDATQVVNTLARPLANQARHNHPTTTIITLTCYGYNDVPIADCTLRVYTGPKGHRRLLERADIGVARVRYHKPRLNRLYHGWVTTRFKGKRHSLELGRP